MSRITSEPSPQNGDDDKRGEDKRCHGQAGQVRCTFRAEVWADGRGMCGWHQRIRHDDRANTLDELERWQAILLAARICDRWTHFAAGVLWDSMRGGGRTESARWCGGGDCPHRVELLMPGATTKPPERLPLMAEPDETEVRAAALLALQRPHT